MKPYYEQSGITIYHGDCFDILPSIKDADLLLTDPPYAVSVSGSVHIGQPGRGTRALDFFPGDSDWPEMTSKVLDRLNVALTALSVKASVYTWIGHRMFGHWVANLEGAGWSTRFLVWAKECPVPPPPGAGWPSAAELCVYAYRPGREWTNNVPRSNVLVADGYRHGQPGKLGHPTQKPPGVIVPLILASSKAGDLVLDPFMGSGTTLRAAKDLGRKAIGIEIEERYCEIAANRLAQEVLF